MVKGGESQIRAGELFRSAVTFFAFFEIVLKITWQNKMKTFPRNGKNMNNEVHKPQNR